eukprot:2957017-Lingulodinium_polyedra.AAC.1
MGRRSASAGAAGSAEEAARAGRARAHGGGMAVEQAQNGGLGPREALRALHARPAPSARSATDED